MQMMQPVFNSEIVETLGTCKQALTKEISSNVYTRRGGVGTCSMGYRKAFWLNPPVNGSATRQTLTPDSDLDLLVVLKPPFDYFQEIHTLVDILYPLQLNASHWISAKPADQAEFSMGATQLYRNVQQHPAMSAAEEIAGNLERAASTLQAAKVLLASGFPNDAASRVYYNCTGSNQHKYQNHP